MCNAEMSFLETSIGEHNYKIDVVIITKDGGKTWGFRKVTAWIRFFPLPPSDNVIAFNLRLLLIT